MNLDRFLRVRLVRDRIDFLRVHIDVLLLYGVAKHSFFEVTLGLGEANPEAIPIALAPTPRNST
jgi:hypothetical protein